MLEPLRRPPYLRRLRTDRAEVVRLIAIACWLGSVLAWYTTHGWDMDRNDLLIVIASFLLVASIGRRPLWMVAADWLPFAAFLIAYDYTREVADTLGSSVQWWPQLDIDKWIFGGTVPNVWLQEQLKDANPQWWEAIVSVVYSSFFAVPYVVAGILWLRNRLAWRAFVLRFVVVSFVGLVTYVVFPAAPPWAAAACTPAQVANHPANPHCMYTSPATTPDGGLLGPLHPAHPGAAPYLERLSNRGWSYLHLHGASRIVHEGQEHSNAIAAMPSLHAACTLLIALFLWRRVAPGWRVLLAAYPAAMAFTLVYTGEHYVSDILAGWTLAVLVMVGFGLVGRRRQRIQQAALDTLDAPQTDRQPDGDQLWPPTATTPSSTSANAVALSTPPARSTAVRGLRGITGRLASS